MTTPTDWAVVLGVSCGTGAAVARGIAESPGLDIFGVHRGNYPSEADAVAADCAAHGRRVHMRVVDAGTVEGARDGAAELAEVAGERRVRVLVHSLANASVGRLVAGSGAVVEPKQIKRTFDSMAHSFVYWAQELRRRDLLAPNARLVGLTNPLGDHPLQGCAVIAAAKGALEVFVRYLAGELGPEGHRVNVVNFGALDTKALRAVVARQGTQAVMEVARRATPARQLVSAEEVAGLVSFLVGDGGGWFNGATIDFTGGEALGYYDALVEGAGDGDG